MSTETKPKRFRIAFSFAGEKRGFVQEVAEVLARCLGKGIGKDSDKARILYDKFHEAEFGRYDLGVYLPPLYRNESDLVVAVFSTDYDTGRWTGWEWMAIHAQLTREEGSKVLLSRYDLANPRGLFENAGFIELDGKTPHQFATLILERLATNEGKPLDHYTKQYAQQLTPPLPPFVIPHSSFSIPHNLPALQPFFGREEELRHIAESLEPESRTWGVLIDGPGGMGKTSLAVRAAYDASSEHFKKIIYISLKTRDLDDDGVRDLSGLFILSGIVELLNELARELGCDDITKAPEDQRPRLLLNALRGTQTLLVLDNLESLLKHERDTLFTFVKKLPTGCKAIFTSRERIGSGAEELILDKLSQEAALSTLQELSTHNPHLAKTSAAERLELYRETAGKPLLLRWTAGQLGRGHCLTFCDALNFIRSCPEGNDPLEFIFGDLVEDFDAAETQALCALAYFTQPAKVEHVAAIAGLPELETGRVLRKLTVHSLAVPTDELKSFSLVPMVADFLRKKKPEGVAKAGDRLEKRAYELFMKCGYDNHDRFPELEAAWPGIAPALALFIAGDNRRLQTVCSSLRDFLDFHGRYDEHLILSENAEKKALDEGDYYNAGSRVYQAGYIYRLRRKPEAVIACAKRAFDHWSKAKATNSGLGYAVDLGGIGHRLKGNFFLAIETHRKALELHRSVENQSIGIVICLNWLAKAEQLSGDLVKAQDHYNEALFMAHALEYNEGVAYVSGNLAELALVKKDWPTAERLVREALSCSEKIHRRDLIAEDYYRLATALVRQGNAEEALPHARRAVEIYTHLGSPDLAIAQETLAECEEAVANEEVGLRRMDNEG